MYKILLLSFLLKSLFFAEVITPIEEVKHYDKEKVSLGKKLFFDVTFSKDGTVSCASCHSDFGSDSRPVSIGVGGKKGLIQSLSVFNAVNNYKQFWNARASSLEEQIDGPIHNDFEMGISKESIEEKLNSSKIYQQIFSQVYNESPNYQLFKDAIVAFEKTLLTPNSRFDRYLKGEQVLTSLEIKGFESFKQHGCIACHNGVNVGGNSMQMMGSVIEYNYVPGQQDVYAITKDEADKNVFRVPSLRNVNKTAPYFHDASAVTLKEAIVKMAHHNLGTYLESNEVEAIEAFLKTLDGTVPTTWSQDVK
jgi:cytochrome c peroxidase